MSMVIVETDQITPPGTIMGWPAWGLPSEPEWISCNGQAVNRTTYSDLFSIIGTTYGAGNGTTTFNIPDLRGEFIRMVDASGSGRDPDGVRALGSIQQQATMLPTTGALSANCESKDHAHGYTLASGGGHTHKIDQYANSADNNEYGMRVAFNGPKTKKSTTNGTHTHSITFGSDPGHTHGDASFGAGGDAETHDRYYTLYWMVKT